MQNQEIPLGAIRPPVQPAGIPIPAVPEPATDSRQARLRRVLDYQAGALHKEDALEANLGSINSGLMRVALGLEETIDQTMGSDPWTVERLQRVLPVIETQLRVARQVDRFARIEVQAAETRKRKADRDSEGATCPEPARITENHQSEEIEV